MMNASNALKVDVESAPDGTLMLRLPAPGRFRVHVEATWEPVVQDRRAIFEAVRRRGNPLVLELLERLGEEAIADPEMLLHVGSIDDPTFVEPPDPPPQEREPVE
jgi:hypothetical protein